MTFKAGLRLAAFSMYQVPSRAQSIFAVIEGPNQSDQISFQGSTLQDGELSANEIELISTLFNDVNRLRETVT
jgi:hypothetical protein